MARAQDGDRDAYRALLEDIRGPLLGFIRRRIADPHEVEDTYQETLIALHRARHTYDPSRPFEPWLFAIARHVATDHNRRRFARLKWEVMVDEVPEGVAESDDRSAARLSAVLGQLPRAQREAFEMLKLEGMSVEGAATRAGVSAGALKVRAHRAYKTIKALLGG